MKTEDNTREELLEMLESAANFLRGMTIDPSIPAYAKSAIEERIKEIDATVDKYE